MRYTNLFYLLTYLHNVMARQDVVQLVVRPVVRRVHNKSKYWSLVLGGASAVTAAVA